MSALVLPGLEVGAGPWQVRNAFDGAAAALADRHYSRRKAGIGSGQVGGPGRRLIFVSPCERALWVTRWNTTRGNADALDCWRCSIFRNEGAGLSSDLIVAAMDLTAQLWAGRPRDGWVTWIDTRKVRHKRDPGRCYLKAGWWVDRDWTHRYLIRLRAEIAPADERAARQATTTTGTP